MLCCRALREGQEWEALSEARRRIVESELRDFVLGGVALEVRRGGNTAARASHGKPMLLCTLLLPAAQTRGAAASPVHGMCSHAARVHLQGEEKERFNEIKQELSQISTKFSNNLLVEVHLCPLLIFILTCCRRCVKVLNPCTRMSIP